jgi:lysine 6-dehydrogenase
MSKIIVLGAGMIGSAMAIDLAKNHQVTLTDISLQQLKKVKDKCPAVTISELDVTDKTNLQSALKPFDIVISSVPSCLGYATLKSIIESGKDVVDITFSSQNSMDLDKLAKEKRVTAIIDCGVAPGFDNLLLGYYNEKLKLTDFECLVGGLPKQKKWPFYYKAPFAPKDVIEEYTRPARYVNNSNLITREALSDPEFVEFDKVGTLESFNTDGLRSIIFTMPHIKNMKEKTLRYPGHIEYIRVLKESGFFSNSKIEVDGAEISPHDFTCKILFNEWKLGDSEEEITVMRISLKGDNAEGISEEVVCDLYDEYSTETQTSSMARTTGYTATAAANLVLAGLFTEKGVFPPELIGKNENCFSFIFNYLKERNINYIITTDAKT